jgi:uncharacterized membrane protein YfcA
MIDLPGELFQPYISLKDVWVVMIIFVATLVRSSLGFGDALLAMPLLGMLVGFPMATPLMGMVAPTISSLILLSDWRKVEWQINRHLILATILGIPFGLLLLRYAPGMWVKGILGVLLIGFGLFRLMKPNTPELKQRRFAYAFGILAGILGAAYNTNGPPVVVYGSLRRWSPERFRATLQGYFFPTGMFILLGQAAAGLWSAHVLRLYFYSLPFVLVAIWVGGRLNRRISFVNFERVVFIALVVFGAMLLF